MVAISYAGRTYEVRAGESLLDAFVRGGADVRFSCRKGSCHTCLLRSVGAAPPPESQRGVPETLARSGHFLPCICHPSTSFEVEPADLRGFDQEMLVHSVTRLSDRVVSMLLEPTDAAVWIPGQHLWVSRPDGESRPYSIASIAEEDYFVELHVARQPEGVVSNWLHDHVGPGDTIRAHGPSGAAVYSEAMVDDPLWIVATGSGAGAAIGVLRDAIRRAHRGPLHLVLGARTHDDMYARTLLHGLPPEQLGRVDVRLCVSSGPVPDDMRTGRVTSHVFDVDCEGAWVIAFGNVAMVSDLRVAAVQAGIARPQFLADPFESAHPSMPDDKAQIAALDGLPELWKALDEGRLLRTILEAFYSEVYRDERLAPFFHGVTMERAVSKQYEFLASLFTRETPYFGLNPFNAHHWMVISDELFDYREALFERIAREHGMPEWAIRDWGALHETFRASIVKSTSRGMIVDGAERMMDGFSDEVPDLATVCDGCGEEIAAGEPARMHRRLGTLYCYRCNRN